MKISWSNASSAGLIIKTVERPPNTLGLVINKVHDMVLFIERPCARVVVPQADAGISRLARIDI